jgi:uncharacterized repeat protein (TIGR02543 family)
LIREKKRMKRITPNITARVFIALLAAVFLMGLSFAGVAAPVTVGNAAELATALSDAATSGDATTIYYSPGTSVIEITGSLTIPANVTLDLSAGGGTLRVRGALGVRGVISGGAVEVAGGTLLRESGSSITATITTSGGGAVRGARVLTLENLNSSSGESIAAITYAGESGTDTSSYVTRTATGAIYAKMEGSNYSSFKAVKTVVTDAGNVFRLGTKNTDTLSLTYEISYGGLTGATLTILNPTSYTASDAAITLNNPAMDGYVFAGWTCTALGVTVPEDNMAIPEGTKGDLTFVANWLEDPSSGGMGGGSGSFGGSGAGAATTDDAAAQQEAAAAADQPNTTSTNRRVRVASASTEVTFTSGADTLPPTLESVRGQSFPWGWVVGGLAGIGVVIGMIVRLGQRKKQS